MTAFQIANRYISVSHPVYIVAELSANHNGSLDRALELIRVAKKVGADAVKLQTYTADTITIDVNNELFTVRGGTAWDGRTLHSLYNEATTPWEWYPILSAEALNQGLALFSTPFDESAVAFLEAQNTPAYKVASFELVDLPLLRKMAATGKPMIISTGMASLCEIEEALTTVRAAGAQQIILLKCTSSYPALPNEMNLRTIPHLADTFGVLAGLSDHTLGITVPIAAVTLGACLIEKHLTLSRADGGVDSGFSLEPDEFREMVNAIRITEQALGEIKYAPNSTEKNSLKFRRSLFVVREIRAGELFTLANVRSIRPSYGLHPRYLEQILGHPAARDIPRGTPLEWSMIGN